MKIPTKNTILISSLLVSVILAFIAINSVTKTLSTNSRKPTTISTNSVNIPWKRKLGSFGEGTSSRISHLANLGDITGDGKDDLVLSAGEWLFVLNGTNGKIISRFDPHRELGFLEVIADVNSDGSNDVVFTVAGDSVWHVVDPLSDVAGDMNELASGYKYRFLTALKTMSSANRPEVGALIVSGCSIGNSGGVACIDGKDSELVLWERTDIGGCAKDHDRLLVVPDTNGDGIDDVYVNTYNGTDQGGYMLNGANGVTLWSNSSFHGRVFKMPDTSGDSIPDIATEGSSGLVYIASNDGSLILQGPAMDNWVRVFSDLSGDGFPDLVKMSRYEGSGEILKACDGKTGEVLWNRTTPKAFHFTLEINDLNGDGSPEVGCGTCAQDDSMYCLSGRNGSVIWQLKQTDWSGSEQGFVFGDINGNGYQEIINIGFTEIICVDSMSSGITTVNVR